MNSRWEQSPKVKEKHEQPGKLKLGQVPYMIAL